MGVRRKKLPVQELEIGMFVADLDRPWHETPFPIQGFYIRNQQELDQPAGVRGRRGKPAKGGGRFGCRTR